MEDQRNWTDASYKTFSTPLRLPYPVEVPAGARIAQTVTLALRDERSDQRVEFTSATEPLTFPIDAAAPASPLPPIGLGMASHSVPLTATEISRLRALNLRHLRVDLVLADPASSGAAPAGDGRGAGARRPAGDRAADIA